MRIFVAVFPPAATQTLAAGLIERLRRPGDGVSWVKPDNLHYTLRFLGELGEDGARRVGESADEAVTGLTAFEVTLGGTGGFPRARGARVIWLGLTEGTAPFVALGKRVETALARRGFEPERRGFTPHLTLGRVREPSRDWTDTLAALPSIAADPAARFSVDALAVVESTLSPKGSIYRVWRRAELARQG
ncbi:MAG: RNA 2',3'-cyclic phosphodiesterase [Candidatus Eisenbacteria bacterium]